MEETRTLEVEVIYATPQRQIIMEVKVSPFATIKEAIEISGILDKFPDIDLAVNKVGVFGKLSKLQGTLRKGDRIEIYRKLLADPKEVRRQRALEGKTMKKGG